VEFGYKAQLIDNEYGIVLDYDGQHGNPHDAATPNPSDRTRQQPAGWPPRTVTADRGYADNYVGDDLCKLGVRTVVIRRTGSPSKQK
jgi:IS5 family transposase